MMRRCLKYMFAPRLYEEYGPSATQGPYRPSSVEKLGDQVLSTLCFIWNVGSYMSPIIIVFLFRRGYFVIESVLPLSKIIAGMGLLTAFSLGMRGIGRSQSPSYVSFVRALDNYRAGPSIETRKKLANFDFDFRKWPVDFKATNVVSGKGKPSLHNRITNRAKSFLKASMPCEVIAYAAVNTFGIRMIYPGCVKLLQTFIEPILLQGRSKLIKQEKAVRYKVETSDSNEIDVVFVDNRAKSVNGNVLVICSEGNAGFYEIGIMSTPLALKYSVIGWNHPGFAGSTGLPFPNQDEEAIDSIMQFAIEHLGFKVDSILLFGWSIGGYTTLWAASRYPEIKGIILDATFDDVLHLALTRMPKSFSNIVKLAIRNYVNLNQSELIIQYGGPILMIRRTEDEIICTRDNDIGSNRGNFLLLNVLRHRFPNIFKPAQMTLALKLLSAPVEKSEDMKKDEESLLMLTTYVSDNGRLYPLLIGDNFSEEQRNQLVNFFIRKYFRDFASTHCTPLPPEFFQLPWDLPSEHDLVLT